MIDQLTGEFKSIVDQAMEKNLKELAGAEVSKQVSAMVKKLRLDRDMFGRDASGLDDEIKIAFVQDIKKIVRGEKAALLENNDSTGGYLVPAEVHAGIMRIAASVGLVARDAMHFTMTTDTLDIPRYTGSDLQGEYIGEDEEGSETSVSFGDAKLSAKTWIVLFRVGNTLIADANVNVADWLLGLVAEGLASRMDKEGFIGGTFTGSPFVGILGSSDVTTYSMPTGASSDAFSDFNADYASDVIGNVEESILNGCAFYFHRTVWAKIRQQKTANGMYTVGQNNSMIAANFKKEGIMPAGVLWDYPVYTTDALPANSASAASTAFGVFGNLQKGLYVGDRQNLEIARNEGTTIGGKNTFAANQVAIRALHRHAITIGLPAALVVIKTGATS